MTSEKILVLGVTGMLGHKLFEVLSRYPQYEVNGTTRNLEGLKDKFSPQLSEKIIENIDAENFETIEKIIFDIKPDTVINCIGIIKQLPSAKDSISAIYGNALLPHKIHKVCLENNARFITVSTDCIFDGKKGNYNEDDKSTAEDLYGKSKYLGEIKGENAFTIRTSIIGHQVKGKFGLLEWFLAQEGKINGFKKAIFSGFPTLELSKIIAEYILPDKSLQGLYHVSSEPISKYELLNIIADVYGKKIKIVPENEFLMDRSLNSLRFRTKTGYNPPTWPKLVKDMYEDFKLSSFYRTDLQ